MLRPGLAELGRTEVLEVTCRTCHRSNTRPVRLQDVLAGETERARASFRGCLEVNPEATWCRDALDRIDAPRQR